MIIVCSSYIEPEQHTIYEKMIDLSVSLLKPYIFEKAYGKHLRAGQFRIFMNLRTHGHPNTL
jgi:hypothetical protein